MHGRGLGEGGDQRQRPDRGRGGAEGVPVSPLTFIPEISPAVVVAALGVLGRLGMVVHGITQGDNRTAVR